MLEHVGGCTQSQHPSAPFEQCLSKAGMLVLESKHWEMCGSSAQKSAHLSYGCREESQTSRDARN